MGKKKHLVKSIHNENVVRIRLDASFFFERAVRSMDQQRYDRALKYFQRAVEFEPENPMNHCNMAGILSEMGYYKESNEVLQNVIDYVDPEMTECHFYMANNFANMEDFEAAEKSLVHYLETDVHGFYLEESEEMMELFSHELERPIVLNNIKSQEDVFEHDQARHLLEEGRFLEATELLEMIVQKYPDFLAAYNNLALAYYYLGEYKKVERSVRFVLERDSGNLHALCNLAILYHTIDPSGVEYSQLIELLDKTYPFQEEYVFKLATTMGILERHEAAFRHFKRLIKLGVDEHFDPCIFHYGAVAAYNTNRMEEAVRLWRISVKNDVNAEVSKFFLSQVTTLKDEIRLRKLAYDYHFPFEDQFRLGAHLSPHDHLQDPLVRASVYWGIQSRDLRTKLNALQVCSHVMDEQIEESLKKLLMSPEEDDYIKKVAIFILRGINADAPLEAFIQGKKVVVDQIQFAPNLPIWEEKWQDVMNLAIHAMNHRYDMIQQHDLQTLWIEFLTRTYPDIPKLGKLEGWAAALEYLTAKMHRKEVTYVEVAKRYGVSITTVSKNVKIIDEVCGVREKMKAIFPDLI